MSTKPKLLSRPHGWVRVVVLRGLKPLGSWILRLQYQLLFYSPTPSRPANAQQLQSPQALALKVMFPLKLPRMCDLKTEESASGYLEDGPVIMEEIVLVMRPS